MDALKLCENDEDMNVLSMQTNDLDHNMVIEQILASRLPFGTLIQSNSLSYYFIGVT